MSFKENFFIWWLAKGHFFLTNTIKIKLNISNYLLEFNSTNENPLVREYFVLPSIFLDRGVSPKIKNNQ